MPCKAACCRGGGGGAAVRRPGGRGEDVPAATAAAVALMLANTSFSIMTPVIESGLPDEYTGTREWPYFAISLTAFQERTVSLEIDLTE